MRPYAVDASARAENKLMVVTNVSTSSPHGGTTGPISYVLQWLDHGQKDTFAIWNALQDELFFSSYDDIDTKSVSPLEYKLYVLNHWPIMDNSVLRDNIQYADIFTKVCATGIPNL